jgi:hypothetical protein
MGYTLPVLVRLYLHTVGVGYRFYLHSLLVLIRLDSIYTLPMFRGGSRISGTRGPPPDKFENSSGDMRFPG